MISCYLNQDYALYCIEWLIWKYRIDLNCTEFFIYCVIPYYETGLLPKFSQILDFTKIDRFYDWLHPYSVSGCSISKKNLIKLIIKRKTLSNFLAEGIVSFITRCNKPEHLKDVANFILSIIYEITDVKMGIDKTETILSNFQTCILLGLKSIRIVRSTMLLIILRLSSCLKLDQTIIQSWLKEIFRDKNDGLEWEALQTAYNLMLQQDFTALSKKLCKKRDVLISKLDHEKSIIISTQFDNLIVPETLEVLNNEKMEIVDDIVGEEERESLEQAKVEKKGKNTDEHIETLISSSRKLKKTLKRAQPEQIFGVHWENFLSDPLNSGIFSVIEGIFRGQLTPQLSSLIGSYNEEFHHHYILSIALKIIKKYMPKNTNQSIEFSKKFEAYLLSFLVSPVCDHNLCQTAYNLLLAITPCVNIKNANFTLDDNDRLVESRKTSPTLYNYTIEALSCLDPLENLHCWSSSLYFYNEDCIQHIVENISSTSDFIVKAWRLTLTTIESLFETHETLSMIHVDMFHAVYENFFNNLSMANFLDSDKFGQNMVAYESLVVKCILTLVGNVSMFLDNTTTTSEKNQSLKKKFMIKFNNKFEASFLLDRVKMNYLQYVNSLQFCAEGFFTQSNAKKLSNSTTEIDITDVKTYKIVNALLQSLLRSNSLVLQEFSFQLNKQELATVEAQSTTISKKKMTSLDVLVKRSTSTSLSEFTKGKVKRQSIEDITMKRLNLAMEIGVGLLSPIHLHLINFIDCQNRLSIIEAVSINNKLDKEHHHQALVVSESEDEDCGFVSGDDQTQRSERHSLAECLRIGIHRIVDLYTHIFESVEKVKEDQLRDLLVKSSTQPMRGTIKRRLIAQFPMSKEHRIMAKCILDPLFLAMDIFSSSITFQQKVLAALTSAAHIYPVIIGERIVQMLQWILRSTNKTNSNGPVVAIFRFDNENTISIMAKLISTALPKVLESNDQPSFMAISILKMFSEFLTGHLLKMPISTATSTTSKEYWHVPVKIFTGIIHTMAQSCFPYPRVVDEINSLKKRKILDPSLNQKKAYWLWIFWITSFLHDHIVNGDDEEVTTATSFFTLFTSHFSRAIQFSAFSMMISYFTGVLGQLKTANQNNKKKSNIKRRKDNSICLSESSTIMDPDALDNSLDSIEDIDRVNKIFAESLMVTTPTTTPVKREPTSRKRSLDATYQQEESIGVVDNNKVWTFFDRVMSSLAKIYCSTHQVKVTSSSDLIFHGLSDEEEISAYTTVAQRMIHFSAACSAYASESFIAPLALIERNQQFMVQLQTSLPAHLNLRFILDMFHLDDMFLAKKAIELSCNSTGKLINERRKTNAVGQLGSLTSELMTITDQIVNLIFVDKKIDFTQSSCTKNALNTFLNIIKLIGSASSSSTSSPIIIIAGHIRTLCGDPGIWWSTTKDSSLSNGNFYAEARSILTEIIREAIHLGIINRDNLQPDLFVFMTGLAIDHALTSVRFLDTPNCLAISTRTTGDDNRQDLWSAGSMLHRDVHVVRGLELLSTILEMASIHENVDLFHFSPYHLPNVAATENENQSLDSTTTNTTTAFLSGYLVWLLCKLGQCDLKAACGLKADNDATPAKIQMMTGHIINLLIMLPSAKDLFITVYMLTKYALKVQETSLLIGVRKFIGSMNCNVISDLLYLDNPTTNDQRAKKMLTSHLATLDNQSRALVLSLIYSLNNVPTWLMTDILNLKEDKDNLVHYHVFCDEGVNASLNLILAILNKDSRLSIMSSLIAWSLDVADDAPDTNEQQSLAMTLIKVTNIFTLFTRLSGNMTSGEFIDYSRRTNLLDFTVSLVSLFSDQPQTSNVRLIEMKKLYSLVKTMMKPSSHLASVCGKSEMIGQACLVQTINLMNVIFESDVEDSTASMAFNDVIIALPDCLASLLSVTKESDDNVPLFVHDKLKNLYLNFVDFTKCDEAVIKPFIRQLCDKLTASGRKSAHWLTRKSIILLLRDILQRSLGLDALDSTKIMTTSKDVTAASISFNKSMCQEIMNALSQAMEDERCEVEIEASRLTEDLTSAIRTYSVSSN